MNWADHETWPFLLVAMVSIGLMQVWLRYPLLLRPMQIQLDYGFGTSKDKIDNLQTHGFEVHIDALDFLGVLSSQAPPCVDGGKVKSVDILQVFKKCSGSHQSKRGSQLHQGFTKGWPAGREVPFGR